MINKLNGSMLKKAAIVIGILMLVVFIINKAKVEQSPKEIVTSFKDELLEIESSTTKNTIQNYFDSVGVKSSFEIYEAAKEARDVSLLAVETINNIKIKSNIPDELYQPMNNIKRDASTSYELLASAFNYAMEYYGGDLNKKYAFVFRENYDQAIKLQEEVMDTLVTLEFFANSVVKINENKKSDIPTNEDYLSENQSNETHETSKLSLMDFVEKVNRLSLEQVENAILHRPSYQELKHENSYNFISITSEDIVIVTDKNSFIKEITWSSEEGLNEEILLNIQWLLLSLGNNISYNEVNEFIFKETLTKQRIWKLFSRIC